MELTERTSKKYWFSPWNYEFKLAELLGVLVGPTFEKNNLEKYKRRVPSSTKYRDRQSLLEVSRTGDKMKKKVTWVLRTASSPALALLSLLSVPCSFCARIVLPWIYRNIWMSHFIYLFMYISSPVVSLNACGGLLGLLEPLVLAVGPVLRLDQRRSLRHLFPVAVLKIWPFKDVWKETKVR